jgi:putative oxidoreductase
MGITTRFLHWNHTHQSFLLLVARIVLGVILLLKGIFFISHSPALKDLILQSRFAAGVGFLAVYITFAHLFGGVLLIIGLFTRVAALLQLPVLLGALFFILPEQGFGDAGSELMLSFLVLILLLVVLIRGSGEFSMESYLKTHLL